MKKAILFLIILILSTILFGCTSPADTEKESYPSTENQQNKEADKAAVEKLVEEFGRKLQNVSLLAPKDMLSKSMLENYSNFVTPALLEEWQKDPLKAPGRKTSSPWPGYIDNIAAVQLSDTAYEVKGEIIKLINAGEKLVEVAAVQPITLSVQKIGDAWLINSAKLGAEQKVGSVIYTNAEYGFSFNLPKGWKGFSVVSDKWEGIALNNASNNEAQKIIEAGPIISIRHPQWSSLNPRQDIPIMIFTLNQWNMLQKEEFHIGAAPFGPSELGRNKEYVFALPARYNYAFPTGYEEVESILKNGPLQTKD